MLPRATLAVAAVGWLAIPAQAQTFNGVTCEQVRKLTYAERWYWIRRLKLTDEQVRQIKLRCGIK